MIHPKYRKIGVMTEALALIKEKSTIWGKRIIATVSPNNINSLKLLQRWGIDKQAILIDEETGEEYLKITLI